MALIFLPSLQHIAAVKVALSVYNGDIIRCFGEFITEPWSQMEGSRERKEEISKKLSAILPELLVSRVVPILQPILDEVHFWVRDHLHFIKLVESSHITNNLCWKPEGTIDREKTSKQLIQDESIDKGVRFGLASAYFYREEVLQLWQRMTAEERETISRVDSLNDVKYWMERLREDPSSDLELDDFLVEFLGFDHQEQEHFGQIFTRRIRISSFYCELNRFYKKAFLSLCPEISNFDDLRVCYYLTAETERDEVFHSPDFSKTKTKHLLSSYIDWPLQPLLLDAINQMWDHLTPECFEHCLNYIVNQKLLKSMEDFDYLQLYEDLWNRIPDSYKEQFSRKTLNLARNILCDKKYPSPFSDGSNFWRF